MTLTEQDKHFHGRTRYKPTDSQDFRILFEDMKKVREINGESLNVHLPYEIQHPDTYRNIISGLVFIKYGELLKRVFHIPLYWENAPELQYGTWDLSHGQTDWTFVPGNIDLTLDVGHLMIGENSIEEARSRIEHVLFDRKSQIKHLHIHENDLRHDEHWPIGKIITPVFLSRITSGVTYIFEKGETVNGITPRSGEWIIR